MKTREEKLSIELSRDAFRELERKLDPLRRVVPRGAKSLAVFQFFTYDGFELNISEEGEQECAECLEST